MCGQPICYEMKVDTTGESLRPGDFLSIGNNGKVTKARNRFSVIVGVAVEASKNGFVIMRPMSGVRNVFVPDGILRVFSKERV